MQVAQRNNIKAFIRIKVLSVSFLACSCSTINERSVSTRDVCNINLNKAINFENLSVRSFTDSHGSYFSIDICPGHTVAADFTNSDLYTVQHESLFKQMRISAYQGGYPIKLKISGIYKGSRSEADRATMFVHRILEYKLNR